MEKIGRKRRARGGRRRGDDARCPFKKKKRKKWASGMICMPEKDFRRVSSDVERESERAAPAVYCRSRSSFYLLDLTGQSWAVLFFSWR